MGRVAGTLRPAPAAAAEGPVATGSAARKPAAAGGGPTTTREGPTAGGVGPYRTHGLKE